MYYFPNLDSETRLIMISELERDLKNGLFYEPSSIKSDYLSVYKGLLKDCIEKGNVESLEQALKPYFFREKDRKSRKISSNINKMIAFSDFNRYYVRAILVQAINENKSVYIYRAKQSLNERRESESLVNRSYFDKNTLLGILHILRDYRLLFSSQSKLEFMRPNSGLSLRLSKSS